MASADPEFGEPTYGNDGYFSAMSAGEMPMRSIASEADARKVLFGRSGNNIPNAAQVVESADADTVQVDGKYLVLGKGAKGSKNRSPMESGDASWATSATTSLVNNEVLLWADDVVTSPFTFAAGASCDNRPCNTFDAGTASDGVASYEAYVAQVSRQLGSNTYYSDFELGQVGAALKLNAVCVKDPSLGCAGGYAADQSTSAGSYRVFPLSTGDMAEYFNAVDGYVAGDDAKRQCSAGSCNNSAASGSWLRSARWDIAFHAFYVRKDGNPGSSYSHNTALGLRPALRLQLDDLLLSAVVSNQGQSATGDLQLTFVDDRYTFAPNIVAINAATKELTLTGTSSAGFSQESIGWKLIDPNAFDGSVVASGSTRTNGNMTLPSNLNSDTAYELYVWGQDDGSTAGGWSNKATAPVTLKLSNDEVFEEYAVTYDLGGDSAAVNDPDNPTTIRTSQLPFTLNPARLPGSRFDGWYADASLTGSPIVEIPGDLSADVTYYAKFAPLDLGPDGYFHEMAGGEKPMRSIASEADARKVLFGRSGSLTNAARVVESGDADTVQVDGKYLALGKGPNTNTLDRSPRSTSTTDTWAWSKTTQLTANEVLLWAADVVTSPFAFANGSMCNSSPCNTFDAGTAADGLASYESYVATVSQQLGSTAYYSDFELGQLGAASQLNAVCIKDADVGCNAGFSIDQDMSVGSYRVFPLSSGDMAEYFNAVDGLVSADNVKRRCPSGSCNNSTSGAWLRSAIWNYASFAFFVRYDGSPYDFPTDYPGFGLRPALRLQLGDLLLSADSKDQSQLSATVTDADKDKSLRLTFVDADKSIADGSLPSISVERSGDKRKIAIGGGSSDFAAEQTGWGWKMVDPGTKADDTSDDVVNQSGRSNKDVATDTDGNMTLSTSVENGTTYNLYVWGQVDGSAENGWSNRATTPYKTTVSLVDYHLDGGTNNADNPVGWVGKSESEVTLKAATRSGYKFLGWYDAAAGGEKVTKIPADSTQSYVLYAHWQKLDLGPDGYYSTLKAGALPVVEADAATAEVQDGWANVRRILFGKQGTTGTYGGASVSGGYKTLAKGVVASVADADFGVNEDYSKSATTSVAANEVLLWADDVVTAGFAFDTNDPYRNSFDSETELYKSNLAKVSDAVGSENYSSFEQGLLRSARLEGVCTAAQASGCASGSYTQQSTSENSYKVFPLSIGDVKQYFNHTNGWGTDTNLACPSSTCANSVSGSWLRSAFWLYSHFAFTMWNDAHSSYYHSNFTGLGLRPALRLNLDNLLLSADSSNQSQSTSGDLQLTFVEDGQEILKKPDVSVVRDSGKSKLKFSGFDASSTTFGSAQTGWGWKLVDTTDNAVIASGKSNDGGNLVLPDSYNASHDYTLYYWGQDDGAAEDGWSNRATDVVATSIDVKPIDAHVVQYELHGGENDPANPTIWLDKLPDTVVLQPATRLGYKFLGWFDQETDGNEVTKLAKDRNTNIILHARWELLPSASLPYTGSWPLWWWIFAGMALLMAVSTLMWRSKSVDGFAVGHSLKRDRVRRGHA